MNETLYNLPKAYKIALTIPCFAVLGYVFLSPLIHSFGRKFESMLEGKVDEDFEEDR